MGKQKMVRETHKVSVDKSGKPIPGTDHVVAVSKPPPSPSAPKPPPTAMHKAAGIKGK